jgi:hypothetical protein
VNSNQSPQIPLIVLAGSDPVPAALPEEGADLHPIQGPKGMALKVGGRPLIDVLLEPLKASGCFGPIYIAGPAAEYGESRQGCEVIDTNSGFGANIAAALEVVLPHSTDGVVALTTCDILPTAKELQDLMSDYFARAPINFWFPLIVTPNEPDQLGASFWKPRYQVVEEPGGKPIAVLPGHLIVVDTEGARVPLVVRAFDLAYKTRNRAILYRLPVMVSGVLAGLVWQDLKHLANLRLPTMTFSVIYNGIMLALELRKGESTVDQLADRLERAFGRYRHRRKYPERVGRLALVQGLSLAKDFDTQEEAEEITSKPGLGLAD